MLGRKGEKRHRRELLKQPWAQIAVVIGLDPVDIEGQGRDILRRIADSGVEVLPKKGSDK